MKLKEYLKEYGFRSGWFAKQVPCCHCYLSTIISGNCFPSLIIRRRIETLTGGLVKETDYEIPDPLKKKPRKSRAKAKADVQT